MQYKNITFKSKNADPNNIEPKSIESKTLTDWINEKSALEEEIACLKKRILEYDRESTRLRSQNDSLKVQLKQREQEMKQNEQHRNNNADALSKIADACKENTELDKTMQKINLAKLRSKLRQ